MLPINRDPEAALQIAKQQKVLFQVAPVDTASKAMAAFPNGRLLAGCGWLLIGFAES